MMNNDLYFVFKGDAHYPDGGMNDFAQSVSGSLDVAIGMAEQLAMESGSEWWQLAQLVGGDLLYVAKSEYGDAHIRVLDVELSEWKEWEPKQ